MRDDSVVLFKVIAGILPAKPESLPPAVPQEIQHLMDYCWSIKAFERPSAQECHELLLDMTSGASAADEIQGNRTYAVVWPEATLILF